MISHRFLARLVIVLAIVSGVGSVVLFAVPPLGSISIALPWSEPARLGWDAGLCLLFFLQHSGMIRPSFRARLAAHVRPEWHAAIYGIASSIALGAVVFLWQPCSTALLRPGSLARWVCGATALGALCLFVWGIRALGTFDPLGVAPPQPFLRHPHEDLRSPGQERDR